MNQLWKDYKMKASVFNQNNHNKMQKMCLVNLKSQIKTTINMILMMMMMNILLHNQQAIKATKAKNGAKRRRQNLRKNCLQ